MPNKCYKKIGVTSTISVSLQSSIAFKHLIETFKKIENSEMIKFTYTSYITKKQLYTMLYPVDSLFSVRIFFGKPCHDSCLASINCRYTFQYLLSKISSHHCTVVVVATLPGDLTVNQPYRKNRLLKFDSSPSFHRKK